MSSEIMLRDATAPTDPDANLRERWENTISTPIVSVTWKGNGQIVAGEYTIAATSATTVNVTSEDPKNELVGTGISVVADDSTPNDHVIKGLDIVFSSSLANGWTGKVSVGCFMIGDGSASDRLKAGIIEAGDTSPQIRKVAYNVGSEDSSETEVDALPGRFIEGSTVEDFVTMFDNHSDPARAGLATEIDLTITFTDYQTGTPNTADVWVDDGGGAVKAIEDAKLDGAEVYEYGAGNGYIDGVDKFKGLRIRFADNPGDPTSKTFTGHVRRSEAWVEYAPDSSGSPGTWQSGPLTLTELGETTGTITAGGYAYYWRRLVLPGSATPGDMAMTNDRVRGLTV